MVALALWLTVVRPAHAESIAVQRASLQADGSGWSLDARFDFELNPNLEDAVNKGIPLYFTTDFELSRARWYWFDEQPVSVSQTIRLSFQPLTRRWRLQVSASPIGSPGLALGQTFDTRDEALAAIQRISNWRIAEPSDVDPDVRHTVDFRFRLDVSQLPRPFKIGVAGQADWNISISRLQRLVMEPR